MELFCAQFGSPPNVATPTENCFRGYPYTPSPPRASSYSLCKYCSHTHTVFTYSLVPLDAPPVCLEWYTSASWSPVPTSIQDPRDGTDRLFIVYQDGNIHVHRRSTGEFIGTFLTVPNVLQDGEAGLTALAFHPNYSVCIHVLLSFYLFVCVSLRISVMITLFFFFIQTNGRFFIHYSCILGAPGCDITCIDGKWCGTGFADACINGTCKADHISVIVEYRVSTANPNVAEPTESRRIMTLAQPFRIHNLGALLFGPGGYMYIGFGDGGNFNDPLGRGQSLNTLLGKVLRIDVDGDPDPYLNYRIPRDNPFYGVSNDDVWNEIWAIGFRNPWSCSFDPERPNKGLFCADVGQDLVEEINLVKPGRNYGWRMWEGNVSTTSINPNNITDGMILCIVRYLLASFSCTGFESAIVMYTRQFIGTNNAVISGHIYRGSRYPSLRGTYLAADHVGILWAMPEVPYDSGKFQLQQLRPICANDSLKCTTTLGNIFTVGVDSRGDIYYVTSRGIYRLVEMDRCKSAITTTTSPPPPLPPSFSTTPALPVTSSPQDTTAAPTTAVVLATLSPPPTNTQTKGADSTLIHGALHVILLCFVVREGLLRLLLI